MGRQFNIRSDRAYEIASEISERDGKTLSAVVEDALAAYQEATETREQRIQRWQAMLAEDRKQMNDSDFKIEDLYDSETGLPA